jgi:hypothetical protein
MSRPQRLPDRPKKATGSFGETSRRHRIEVPSGPVPIDLRQNSLWQTGRTPPEIKSLIHPKAESYAAPRSSIQRAKRSATRTLFAVVYRFHGIDTKIVRIFTDVPYDCGSSKNDLRGAGISGPRRRSSSPRGEDPDRLTQ